MISNRSLKSNAIMDQKIYVSPASLNTSIKKLKIGENLSNAEIENLVKFEECGKYPHGSDIVCRYTSYRS